MRYYVHLFAVVRVKMVNIEATSQREAIEKAEKHADLSRQFNWESPQYTATGGGGDGGTDPYIDDAEFAEEVTHVLVDEEGDTQYTNSTWYGNPDCRESHDSEGEWIPMKGA
jgi:hypothetical protein